MSFNPKSRSGEREREKERERERERERDGDKEGRKKLIHFIGCVVRTAALMIGFDIALLLLLLLLLNTRSTENKSIRGKQINVDSCTLFPFAVPRKCVCVCVCVCVCLCEDLVQKEAESKVVILALKSIIFALWLLLLFLLLWREFLLLSFEDLTLPVFIEENRSFFCQNDTHSELCRY